MGKYKLNKNKPKPTDDKIAGHQNFDQIISNYNNLTNYKKVVKPLYKDKKFLGLVLIVLIVFLAIWLSERENGSDVNTQDQSKEVKGK